MTNQKSSIPPWAGRLPFSPDKKHPIKLKPNDCLTRLYGEGDHKVFTATYLSTDQLSSSSFRTLPGGYFEPYDIHGGDEVYYVASGAVVAFNPFTGMAYPLNTGDFLWIPKGVWHQVYNFGNEEAYVVTAFAPKMWTDMGTNIVFEKEPVLLKGRNIDWRSIPEVSNSQKNFSKRLGVFPVEGPPAREEQDMFVITPDKAIHVINGISRRMLFSFFVSNDFIHAGIITMPANFESDDQCHKGDQLIYGVDGKISIIIKDESFDTNSVSVERVEIEPQDRFFVPENIRYCCVNSGNSAAKAVFFIAPEL
jgi:mannose-6-phosphate isomerase-like protein (cupin superfamily)